MRGRGFLEVVVSAEKICMSLEACRHFLLFAELKRAEVPSFDIYPFCLPAVRSMERLELHPSRPLPFSSVKTAPESQRCWRPSPSLGVSTRRAAARISASPHVRRIPNSSDFSGWPGGFASRRTGFSSGPKASLTWRARWKPSACRVTGGPRCTNNPMGNRFGLCSWSVFEGTGFTSWMNQRRRCRRRGKWPR
jgi:hypothetical protein